MFNLADPVDLGDEEDFQELVGRELATSVTIEQTVEVIDEDTGEVVDEDIEREVILPAEHELEEGDWEVLDEHDVINRIYLIKDDDDEDDDELDTSTLVETLQKDSAHNEEEALGEIYQELRGSEAPDMETARGVLDRLFFSDKRYDLGDVGRHRINGRLKIDVDEDVQTLMTERRHRRHRARARQAPER